PQLSDTTYLSTRPAPPKPTLFPYTTLFRSHAQVLDAPEVPDAIKVQPGEKVLLRARASGVQIYVCGTGTDGKPEWTLKAPDAELLDEEGAVIGHHSAGPSWKHRDGSAVNGK